MIRCVVFRGSKAAGRHLAARRYNSTIPNEPEAQSQCPEKWAAVCSISPKPHLPISPLMDPSFAATREKHHLPKARPNPQEFTPFQRQLRNNPYALALATPVRMCNITKAALPKFFLQDYNLLANPKTGEPWWMPSGLTRKRSLENTKGLEEGIDANERMRIDEEQGSTPEAEGRLRGELAGAKMISKSPAGGTEKKEVVSNHKSRSGKRLLGPTVYTVARKDFLNAVSNKKKIGYGTDLQKQFIDSRLLKNLRSRQLFSKAQWRLDIDEFLLELMRRRVVEDLSGILRLKRGYVVGCEDWAAALSKTQTGAFLWTGKGETGQPSEFATMDVGVTKKQKIPIHNLKTLLGEKKLEELGAQFDNKIFDNEILALRHRRRTIGLQMKLWKLQGYLAEYKETSRLEIQ